MATFDDRRRVLQKVGLGIAAFGVSAGTASATGAEQSSASLLPEGASGLNTLTERLRKAPRRRDFKSVPMILDAKDQWDDEALTEVLTYKPRTKQVWDCTAIEGPWLNGMRNSLNSQVWSFKHPDFLIASAVHGSAQLALYDAPTWEKYQLTKLAGEKFKTNTLIEDQKAASADPHDFEDANGVFSPRDNTIPVLMRRGVVFLSCHNAIWEQAGKLLDKGLNPDKLTHEQLAADLTNHLIPGAVLVPGAVATIPELQHAGFHYIT